jgi:hypothetical protein
MKNSIKTLARIGGLLYLIIIALGLYSEMFVRGKIIVHGNATVTAANIRAMESQWRFGITSELLVVVCAMALGMIYFILLRPVSIKGIILATFLRLLSLTIQAVGLLKLFDAMFPLGNADYLSSFSASQQNALASLAIRSHAYGYGVSLFFLGFCFLVHGTLIYRSGFLPKFLGVLIVIAGVSYLVTTFSQFVAPAFSDKLFPFSLLPAFIGELSLSLWLLIKGVNESKWKERERDFILPVVKS